MGRVFYLFRSGRGGGERLPNHVPEDVNEPL